MIAVLFKFDGETKSDFWLGVAVAPTWEAVFRVIDKHGDPYSCSIARVRVASACWREKWDGDDVECSELEPADNDHDSLVWRPFPMRYTPLGMREKA